MTYQDSLSALADPTRRQIFEHLARAPSAVGQLASQLPVSRPAVSQHLKVLSDAGLLVVEQQGNRRIYAVDQNGLKELRQYLDTLWGDVLGAFADSFEKDD